MEEKSLAEFDNAELEITRMCTLNLLIGMETLMKVDKNVVSTI